ncbi:MAG: hypothetical protein M3Y49_01820 [Actinomycetota bacterium]|nr:hypothetical protein [Actinomycetota bacterium]
MTIFLILLIGGPFFLVAGAVVLWFRVRVARTSADTERGMYGGGKFAESQTRNITPDTIGLVGAIWMVGGAVATGIGLAHIL